MISKHLIPISFFIVCQAIYDFYAPSQNTNWSIFYFSSQYLSWVLLLIIIPSYKNIIKNIPKFVMIAGLMIYIGIELSKIGLGYEEYYLSVNSFQACVLPVVVMITGLTYFMIKLCQR